MKSRITLPKLILFITLAVGLLTFATRYTYAATFTVDLFDGDPGFDAPDDNPGDGLCTVAGGGCSLRAAIQEANLTPEADIITFAGGGVISVGSALPALNGDITIDGWSAGGAGYQGPPLVQLRDTNGTIGAGVTVGIQITGSQNQIIGLSITGFDQYGIQITGSSNQVYGSYIGVDLSGTVAEANGTGIRLQGNNSVQNTFGGVGAEFRNIIAGNNGAGIDISGPDAINTDTWDFTLANSIIGNYIGVDSTGDAALANNGDGVTVTNASYVIIGQPGAGNVISGNAGNGVSSAGGATRGMDIRDNLIGTNAAGDNAIPNGDNGINFNANQWNRIDGNTISGNAGNGIFIFSNGVKSSICNNYIGTNAALAAGIGNGGNGVLFNAGGSGVDGNYIGFSPVFGTISPPACATGNTIAYNIANGVQVQNNARLVAIRGNSIFSNGGLGIALLDITGGGNGPNELIAPPILANAGVDSGTLVLDVRLQQRAGLTAPQRDFEVHFYANSAPCDSPVATGEVEGELYLGTINMTVNGAGFAEQLGVTLPAGFPLTWSITATASGRAIAPPNAGAIWRSTSPFSVCIPLTNASDLLVQKSASQDTVLGGSPFEYIINVTNIGTNPITGITLVDDLPNNVTVTSITPNNALFPAPPFCQLTADIVNCSLGNLAPGGSFIVTINVIAPITSGVIVNRVTVAANEPDVDLTNNQATVFTIIDGLTPTPTSTPTVTPTQNIEQPTIEPSATITFTPTLLATSTTTATATTSPTGTATSTATSTATMTATSTATATATATTTPTATASSTATATTTPTATASSTATPSQTATATATATTTPTATASSTATPSQTATSTATLPPTLTPSITPDLTATLAGFDSPLTMQKAIDAVEGQQVSYNVTVSNQGTQALSNVTLIEQFLQGVELIDVDAGAPVCTKTLDSISCVLGTLNGGSSARVNVQVRTNGTVDPLLSRTIVRSSELPDQALDEPYIIKLASPAFLQQNSEVTWTIRLINPGPRPATNVIVSDTIPAGFDILSASATQGTAAIQGSRVTLRLAQLAPVQAVTIIIRAQPSGAALNSPIISNRACLQTDQRPQQRCVQAAILRVDQLPNTGQSIWSWLRWVVIALAGISIGAAVAWKRRRA